MKATVEVTVNIPCDNLEALGALCSQHNVTLEELIIKLLEKPIAFSKAQAQFSREEKPWRAGETLGVK